MSAEQRLKIELIEDREGDLFSIFIDGEHGCLICPDLGRDEALGVIAAALFKGIDRIPYSKPIGCRAETLKEMTL